MTDLPQYPDAGRPPVEPPPPGLVADPGIVEPGWKRVADVMLGLVIPAGCLVFDPIVFRDGLLGNGGMLGDYTVVGYAASGLGMLSLALWLAFRRWPGLFTGLLAGGAVFAFCLGVVLLPISLVGLLFVIGVLGLTPFGTAWVFCRNAERAWQKTDGDRWALITATCGFVLATVGPWAAQSFVLAAADRAAAQVLSDDPTQQERGAATLRWVQFVQSSDCFDKLVWDYEKETDEARKRSIARNYHLLTGKDIEQRLARLRD